MSKQFNLSSILIVEDEPVAYRKLIRLLKDEVPATAEIHWAQSVEQAVAYLKKDCVPDLIFLDIQLSDGLSFEIFEHVTVDNPVIFCTAYDEYALKAFELNSVDYLLKPVRPERLSIALNKYKKQRQPAPDLEALLPLLQQQLKPVEKSYKNRFLVKKASSWHLIPISEVAYFYREEVVYVVTEKGQKYIVDYSLDQVMDMLDPSIFFRLNRQGILKISCIKKVEPYFNHKLKVLTSPTTEFEAVVSKENARKFKDWLES